MTEIENRVCPTPTYPPTGFSEAQLRQIAIDASIISYMGDNRTREVVVDYTPSSASHIVFFEGDPLLEPPAPITINPIRIVFRLEDQMFGGVTYVSLVADGYVLSRPVPWESFDKLATYVLKG